MTMTATATLTPPATLAEKIIAACTLTDGEQAAVRAHGARPAAGATVQDLKGVLRRALNDHARTLDEAEITARAAAITAVNNASPLTLVLHLDAAPVPIPVAVTDVDEHDCTPSVIASGRAHRRKVAFELTHDGRTRFTVGGSHAEHVEDVLNVDGVRPAAARFAAARDKVEAYQAAAAASRAARLRMVALLR